MWSTTCIFFNAISIVKQEAEAEQKPSASAAASRRTAIVWSIFFRSLEDPLQARQKVTPNKTVTIWEFFLKKSHCICNLQLTNSTALVDAKFVILYFNRVRERWKQRATAQVVILPCNAKSQNLTHTIQTAMTHNKMQNYEVQDITNNFWKKLTITILIVWQGHYGKFWSGFFQELKNPDQNFFWFHSQFFHHCCHFRVCSLPPHPHPTPLLLGSITEDGQVGWSFLQALRTSSSSSCTSATPPPTACRLGPDVNK